MKTRWFVIASICCAFIFCTFVAAKEKQAKTANAAQPTNASENSPDEFGAR